MRSPQQGFAVKIVLKCNIGEDCCGDGVFVESLEDQALEWHDTTEFVNAGRADFALIATPYDALFKKSNRHSQDFHRTLAND